MLLSQTGTSTVENVFHQWKLSLSGHCIQVQSPIQHCGPTLLAQCALPHVQKNVPQLRLDSICQNTSIFADGVKCEGHFPQHIVLSCGRSRCWPTVHHCPPASPAVTAGDVTPPPVVYFLRLPLFFAGSVWLQRNNTFPSVAAHPASPAAPSSNI